MITKILRMTMYCFYLLFKYFFAELAEHEVRKKCYTIFKNKRNATLANIY